MVVVVVVAIHLSRFDCTDLGTWLLPILRSGFIIIIINRFCIAPP